MHARALRCIDNPASERLDCKFAPSPLTHESHIYKLQFQFSKHTHIYILLYCRQMANNLTGNPSLVSTSSTPMKFTQTQPETDGIILLH